MSVRVVCDICNMEFSKQNLKRHKMNRHDERYPCSECKRMFTAKELRIHQKVRVGCQAPLPHTKKRKEPKKKQIFYVQWGTGPIKKAPAYLVKHMQSLSKNHHQEKYDTFSSSLVANTTESLGTTQNVNLLKHEF